MTKKLIVSIQGLPGSFHELAARQYFGVDVNLLHRLDFSQVFSDLYSSRADLAVVAHKNTQYGQIYEVEKLIKKFQPEIVGTVSVEVKFCLLGVKGSSLGQVKQVYSQTPALVQCHKFLEQNLPHATMVEHFDTAGAAADVAKWNSPTKVALASSLASKIYDLEILASDVEDAVGANATDFYVISPGHTQSTRS